MEGLERRVGVDLADVHASIVKRDVVNRQDINFAACREQSGKSCFDDLRIISRQLAYRMESRGKEKLKPVKDNQGLKK